MRYHALICDYDGTLALAGKVDEETLSALERLVASGRKLVLVTGRELEDLLYVFPQVNLFERVVVENGALLYRPATRQQKPLGERLPERFIEVLRQRKVDPLSVGEVIVSTWQPNDTTVLEAIRELGLELHVVFNKGAVMILPSGINKATGLMAALHELGLSPHNVVGIGDGENDHAFLRTCECSVAVANALPAVKESADYVTTGEAGEGAVELINMLLANDLQELEPRLVRHHITLGIRDDNEEVKIGPYGTNLMIAGPSGSGKSAVATGFMERLADQDYQFCIIDPEGDYENFPEAAVLGSHQRAPDIDEILQHVENPDENIVVNLLGLGLEDRPAFFSKLFPRLQELRTRTGRPHWMVVDEAHHLLPASWDAASLTLSQEIGGMLLITLYPEQISPAVLSSVNAVVAIGKSPEATIRAFSKPIGQRPPSLGSPNLTSGEAIIWLRGTEIPPFRFRTIPSEAEHRRHIRKYAAGDLGPEESFYFRGADGKLNLPAQNLSLFIQLAEGVDDETWMYHLRRGDYSRWFRERIKDAALADEAKVVEKRADISPSESRALIKAAIERRYALPISSPPP